MKDYVLSTNKSIQLGNLTLCVSKSTMKDKDRYIYVMRRSLLARNCPTIKICT